MFYLLTLIYSAVGLQDASRVREQTATIHPHTSDNEVIKISNNEQYIKVLPGIGIYDIDLYQTLSDGKLGSKIDSPMFQLDGRYIQDLNIENDCVGIPQQPRLEELASLETVDDDTYYTDIISIRTLSVAYVVTEYMEIRQLKIFYAINGSFQIEYNPLSYKVHQLLDLTENTYVNSHFSCPIFQWSCLLISNHGGIWIQADKFADKNSFVKFEKAIFKRDKVNKVVTYEYDIAVAVGAEGVDIYQYVVSNSSVEVQAMFNLQQSDFGRQTINIVSVHLQYNRLSALDAYDGLYIFSFTRGVRPQLLLHVKINNAFKFDAYENTYLLVAQSSNNLEYLVEIFVNTLKKEYYVNRVFIDDFVFTDIEISSNYAILLGDDSHMLIRHSIFNQFVPYNKEVKSTFAQDGLIKFEFYQVLQDYSDNASLTQSLLYIGIHQRGVKLWKLQEYRPMIVCKFDHSINVNYTALYNSTTCEGYDHQVFSVCQIQQKIQVQVSGALLESDQQNTIFIILIIVLIVILLLVIICWRRAKAFVNRIADLKKQIDEFKKYAQFQEVEQASMVN